MNDHSFESLAVDQLAEREYLISPRVYAHFMNAFEDVKSAARGR